MESLGTFYSGLTGKTKADFRDGNARFVTYMNVYSNICIDTAPEDLVRIGAAERQNAVRKGDVLFTASSETRSDCGMSSVVRDEPPDPLYLNSFCFGLRPYDPETLDPEYAKHLFRSDAVRDQIVRTASGVTRFNISKKRFAKVSIFLPARDEQTRIAAALDKIAALADGAATGLTAELVARRKQYVFYRDELVRPPDDQP